MLAELVDHVVGVDPDRDWITLAVLDARSAGVVAEGRFPATKDGYDEAIAFVDGHSVDSERAWVIEGSAGYGRGLAVALERHGEWVIEFDRPTRKTKDGAKSDALDAVRAAREMLGRKRLSVPRAHDGVREAIRVHAVTRAAAVRARTGSDQRTEGDDRHRRRVAARPAARTAHHRPGRRMREVPRPPLQRRRTSAPRAARCGPSPDGSSSSTPRSTSTTGRSSSCSTRPHRSWSPSAASATSPPPQFYIAWSHPGRCHSEAAFARLGGTSPVPATSGQNQTRHRLNRGGDRQLNRALYLVAVTKRRCDPTTKAYIARRVAEGKTEREAIRCIKRYLARRVWRLLEHPPIRT